MRQSIRGYTDAVLETAEASGQAATVAEQLAAVVQLVRSSEDLRSALSDPGLAPVVRRAILRQLLEGKVRPETAALAGFALEADRAPEAMANLEWLAAVAAEVASGHSATTGQMLGPTAAIERLDGYLRAVLEPTTAAAPALSEIEDELFRFARVVESSEELNAVLTDRDVPPERRAALATDLLGSRAQPATTRLAAYAARYGRPRDYVKILDRLVDLVAAEGDRRVAQVRTAFELGDEQRDRLAQALSLITGHPVELRVSVDPALLGGFVASIGDTVIDGSARHRLELVRERIGSPHSEVITGTGESL